MDSFGSSEFAVIVMREDGRPPGSIGKGYPGVSVYHADTVTECARSGFRRDTARWPTSTTPSASWSTPTVSAASPATTTTPPPPSERMRHGMYWSGDLAYRDADGWIYLAGRTADWMRVDGENLAAGPIERILQRLPEINHVAVYAVPDERVGDQVMAAVVLNDGATLSPKRVRGLPGRPARPVAEGVAAVRPHQRRPAADGDQQDPQAHADQGRRHAGRRRVVGAGGARAGILGAMTAPPPPEAFYPIPSGLPVEVTPARAFVPPPNEDPFYTYSGDKPLEEWPPGSVLATRNIPYHILGVPTPLKTTQLLYRSTSQTGRPTANVTSIIQPAAPARYDANFVVSVRLRLAEPQRSAVTCDQRRPDIRWPRSQCGARCVRNLSSRKASR